MQYHDCQFFIISMWKTCHESFLLLANIVIHAFSSYAQVTFECIYICYPLIYINISKYINTLHTTI
jgi:hypothetical protein